MRFKLLKCAIVFFLSSMLFISIVKADPGISVTITDVDPDISSSGDTATYTVNVESITTEDENVKLTVSGDPNLNFDWATQEFLLLAGDTQSFGLTATVTTFYPGDYEFTVLGEAWPLFFTYEEALLFGIIQTSSYISYVHVHACVSSDSLGNPKDTFVPGEMVYVTVPATGQTVTLYIVADQTIWNEGDSLTDVSDGVEILTLNPGPGTQIIQIWAPPLVVGQYDIVMDVDNDGVFDTGQDLVDSMLITGFSVIPEVPWGTIMASAAMIIALVAYVAKPKWRRKPI